MTLPVSYSPQVGCHDCRFVFVYSEYDCGERYYCTHGAPTRPRCGSVAMGEHFFPDDGPDEGVEPINRWQEWSKGREVQPWGTCAEWEPAEAAPPREGGA